MKRIRPNPRWRIPPSTSLDLGDELPRGCRILQVGAEGPGFAAELIDERLGLVRVAAIADSDFRSGASQRPRDRRADAAAGASDERDPPREWLVVRHRCCASTQPLAPAPSPLGVMGVDWDDTLAAGEVRSAAGLGSWA